MVLKGPVARPSMKGPVSPCFKADVPVTRATWLMGIRQGEGDGVMSHPLVMCG